MQNIIDSVLTKEVVSTICIAIFAFFIYLIIKKVVNRFLIVKAKDKDNRKALTILTLITNIIKYMILIVVVLMILDIWGVDTKALIASLGVVGVVAGLAMQDTIKDIISGATILTENSFKVGDNVSIGGFRGTVTALGMRSTTIRAYSGEIKMISNRNITEVINYSSKNDICAIDIDLSCGDTLEQIEKVLNEICEKVNHEVKYIRSPLKILGIEQLSKGTVTYRLEAEVPPMKSFEFNRIVLKEVKRQFEENNLNISYERLDIHNE